MTNIYTTPNADAYKAARHAVQTAAKALQEAKDNHRQAEIRVEFIRAMYADDFSHARCGMFQGKPSSVSLYRKDPESPSGVSRSVVMPDFDSAVALLDAAGIPFPLSPTEGLRKA